MNLKSITVQSLSKDINIMLTWNRKRDSLRGTSPSIIQREYHNESTEKSPTALEHERHLCGLRLAGVVDLSHDHGFEAVDLVLTSEAPISEVHNGRKKGDGSKLCKYQCVPPKL